MALTGSYKDIKFGVGDKVRVIQKIKEGEKYRNQAFEGMVIGIKGRNSEKTFVVRRIGVQQVGIERIFPLSSPSIERVEVIREGTKGVRHAKLFYTRSESKREVERIYSRAFRKGKPQASSKKKTKAKKAE